MARTVWWLAFAAPVVSFSALIVFLAVPSDASTPPALSVSPSGNYTNGQSISVSVGSNGYFTPHSRVNVIECADPGGLAANLPKDDTTCDGNTIQGSTIEVGSDGSFSVQQYPVYLLPSPTLGEQANFKPVCNQTNYCVLYVGQNQNDFTAPKIFSAPFLVAPGSGSTAPATAGATAPGTAAAATSGSAQSGAGDTAGAGSAAAGTSVSATDPSGSLADTGPSGIEWMALGGAVLLLTGAVGRRMTLRARR
jgi:hypothetical protein